MNIKALDGLVIVNSSKHKNDDVLNFPSLHYQYVLTKEKYKWKVINEKFIGTKNTLQKQ